MRPSDDDDNVNPHRTVEDRTADLLLSGHEVPSEPALGTFLAELRDLGSAPAPAPNLALTAMLEGGLPAAAPVPAPAPARNRLRSAVSWRTASGAVSWRRRSWALPLQLSLASTGCLALVLVAASTNQLPDAAQTAVADVVEAVTPLDLPRPGDDHPKPAVSPTPTVTPEAHSTAGADDSDEGRGPGHGGRGSEFGVDNRDDHADDAGDDSRREGDGHSSDSNSSDRDSSDSGSPDSRSDSGADSSDADQSDADSSDSDADASDSSVRSGSDSPDSSGSGGSDSPDHD